MGEEFKDEEFQEEECNSDLDAAASLKKKKSPSKSSKTSKSSKGSDDSTPAPEVAVGDGEEVQHLEPNVECQVGDKIKVFWRHGQIYEAKIMKAGKDKKEGKFYVHYQGWNQRYDEWITRGKIAENLTWNENPKSSKSRDAKDEEQKKKILKKSKSVTPTSTPSSSRTSSPASMKRTKSPAPPKKAMSPSVKEKTPMREKKKEAVVPATKKGASPIPPQKTPLKRQSSRTSVYKASDEKAETEEAEASDSE